MKERIPDSQPGKLYKFESFQELVKQKVYNFQVLLWGELTYNPTTNPRREILLFGRT